MSLWNSMKRSVSSAQLSADKLLRVNKERTEISRLESEIRKLKRDLGDQAFVLYQSGKLKQKDIVASCSTIDALFAEIQTHEEAIDAIQAEELPKQPLTGHVCPTCEKRLPAKQVYCPDCGTKAIDIVPEEAEPIEEPEAPSVCPECGAEVEADSAFCPSCGVKIER